MEKKPAYELDPGLLEPARSQILELRKSDTTKEDLQDKVNRLTLRFGMKERERYTDMYAFYKELHGGRHMLQELSTANLTSWLPFWT